MPVRHSRTRDIANAFRFRRHSLCSRLSFFPPHSEQPHVTCILLSPFHGAYDTPRSRNRLPAVHTSNHQPANDAFQPLQLAQHVPSRRLIGLHTHDFRPIAPFVFILQHMKLPPPNPCVSKNGGVNGPHDRLLHLGRIPSGQIPQFSYNVLSMVLTSGQVRIYGRQVPG